MHDNKLYKWKLVVIVKCTIKIIQIKISSDSQMHDEKSYVMKISSYSQMHDNKSYEWKLVVIVKCTIRNYTNEYL